MLYIYILLAFCPSTVVGACEARPMPPFRGTAGRFADRRGTTVKHYLPGQTLIKWSLFCSFGYGKCLSTKLLLYRDPLTRSLSPYFSSRFGPSSMATTATQCCFRSQFLGECHPLSPRVVCAQRERWQRDMDKTLRQVSLLQIFSPRYPVDVHVLLLRPAARAPRLRPGCGTSSPGGSSGEGTPSLASGSSVWRVSPAMRLLTGSNMSCELF